MSNLEGELNRNPERLFQTVLKDPNKYSSSFVFDVRLKHIKSGPVTLFEQKEDSGVSDELATSLEQLPVHPLFVRRIGYSGSVDGGKCGDAFSYANGGEPELDGFIFGVG